MTDIKIHLNPLSRDRADFLIHAKCGKAGEDTFWEQLWVKQLTDNQFEICCIPFFARDIAIGDVVETHSDGQFQHLIKRVIQPSGHYTQR